MIKLGNSPKMLDFIKENASFVNTWFREVTNRFSIQRRDSAFVAQQIPTDQWAVTKDNDHGSVGVAINDNGTLKTIYIPPTFYAYRSAASPTITSDTTYDVIVFDAEMFDTEGWYDTATGKFQPLLEGYYFIHGQINFDMNSPPPAIACSYAVSILKNGSIWSEHWGTIPSVGNDYFASVTTQLYLNGSTDYVQLGCWQNTGNNRLIATQAPKSYFTGTLVRGAA